MQIIAIHGKKASGKSTLAQMLCNSLGDDVTRILPFADKVKEFAKAMGWNGKKDNKGRQCLKLLGTEVGRDCIDEKIWINFWIERYQSLRSISPLEYIIVDDLRFQNEADSMKDFGAILIKIIRPSLYTVHDEHRSEQGLDNSVFDRIYVNGGPLEGRMEDKKKVEGLDDIAQKVIKDIDWIRNGLPPAVPPNSSDLENDGG